MDAESTKANEIPTCRLCGCAHLLPSPDSRYKICRYCGNQVRVKPEIEETPKIIDEPKKLCCPRCGSDNLLITKTLNTKPIQRYRLCRVCGYKFKSIQKKRADTPN